MQDNDILNVKRILIVDDEPDILETLEDLLDMCLIDSAPDFESAKKFLDKNPYDAAVLDIMGVRFSVDDFSAGNSSLAYLKRLPVDEIEIDKSLLWI